MTTPKFAPPPKPIKITFLHRSEIIHEQSLSKNCLIIPDSPPFQIPSLSTTLYEDSPQASSLVLNLESKMSHQPIQSPQTAPITLPLVSLNQTGSILPKNPSSLVHQNSPTPTISLAS
ncbi:hypothetical protein O181_060053 [Austropuccinia psidii MF-1]|uniref:Uncharacterized protein n=1 Tax=Austropuccinia psidii MF-1 TaxID=1389203 RepID=A0A9Q3EFU9_9BASI|nr:hypothetical protein [Austropuccinia psidii MF-1]